MRTGVRLGRVKLGSRRALPEEPPRFPSSASSRRRRARLPAFSLTHWPAASRPPHPTPPRAAWGRSQRVRAKIT